MAAEETRTTEPANPGRRGHDSFPRPFGPKYVLLRQIGKGGMAKVYLALSGSAEMRRLCAIKALSFADGEPDIPGLSRRFVDEATIAMRLSHRNLAFVFDAGIEERQRYLAMEFIQGKTLEQVVAKARERGKTLEFGTSMRIVLEVLLALEYVHRFDGLGLIHRDVTPSNIMVSHDGRVRLIDFGIAKWADQSTQTRAGVRWGKVGYIAPEQMTGAAVDHRVDVYAAGVMLWQLLAGRPVPVSAEITNRSTALPPPSLFNSFVPSELDRVALTATAVDPEERYRSAQQFHTILSQYVGLESGEAHVAAVLADLYGAEIAAERAEVDTLIKAAQAADNGEDARKVAEAESDPLIGTIIDDRYEIHRLIGRGAMGSVYEAYHRKLSKRMAIKIANPDETSPELAHRLVVESQVAAQLEHENITGVTDSGTTPGGAYYFVMEYLDGIGLDEVLAASAPLPPERALRIGLQMCRAAQAAHLAGVVHRDLKPANVMLLKREAGEADLVKVLDFGLAKVVSESQILRAGLTRPETAMGTPRYMAPEQFSSGAEAGVPADVYALAMMTYEMLTGRVPFSSTEVAALYSEKLTATPRPVDQLCLDLSAEFANVLMAALAPKADQRPQSVDALIKAIGEEIARLCRNPKPVVAPTVLIHRPSRPRRRWIGMTAAVLGIAGGAAAWALRPSKPPVRPAVPAPQQLPSSPSAVAENRRWDSGVTGGKAIETPVPSHVPEPAPTPDRPVRNSQSEPKAQVASAAPTKVRPKEPTAVSSIGRNTAASHVVAAQGHYYMGDYGGTEREARAAIGLGAGADGYVLLGKALAGLKRSREARQALQQALRLDPLSPSVAEALRNLGSETGP